MNFRQNVMKMYRAPKKFVSGFGNMSNAVAKMARQGGKEAYEKVRPEFPDYSSMSFCRCLEEECTRRATEAVADMGPSVARKCILYLFEGVEKTAREKRDLETANYFSGKIHELKSRRK